MQAFRSRSGKKAKQSMSDTPEPMQNFNSTETYMDHITRMPAGGGYQLTDPHHRFYSQEQQQRVAAPDYPLKLVS